MRIHSLAKWVVHNLDIMNPESIGSHRSTVSKTNPSVTLVVVPRERESVAVNSLRSIYRNTGVAFDLVYIDCLLSRKRRSEIERLVDSNGDKYIRCSKYVYPNQARNVGIAHSQGDYLVFIDNDVVVEPGWLERLVSCASETGAGVVGPLYWEGDRQAPVVHRAGGSIDYVDNPDNSRTLITCQYELGTPLADTPDLVREPTELIEFHCVLITRACLEAIGGRFDEHLRTTREHVDLCLLAKQSGYKVYLEPEAQVGYGIEEKMTLGDLHYFMFRWSNRATKATILHFETKWEVKLDVERLGIIGQRRRKVLHKILMGNKQGFFRTVWHLLKPIIPSPLRMALLSRMKA